MPAFRHPIKDSKYAVEYSWEKGSYYTHPIKVYISEKVDPNDKTNREESYKAKETLGEIKYDKTKARTGYNFKNNLLGDITIKFERKFLIIEKIIVLLNGIEVKGTEIFDVLMNFNYQS